jgi:hypothetical protein
MMRNVFADVGRAVLQQEVADDGERGLHDEGDVVGGTLLRDELYLDLAVQAALAAKRRAGELAGEVPFGWMADDNGHLIEVADEQAILRIIGELRDAGVSLRRIAAILDRKSVV